MRVVLLSLLLWLGLAGLVRAEDVPAGFVTGVKLLGADANSGILLHKGTKLTPKLLAQVFSGDVVHLKEPGSTLSLELDDGRAVTITARDGALTIRGAMTTGDESWTLVASAADVLAGEGEEAVPDNMLSRGGSLSMPMLVSGGNYISKGRAEIWLTWIGGKAPYKAEIGGKALPGVLPEPGLTLNWPPGAERVDFQLSDAEGGVVRYSLRMGRDLPAAPEGVKPGTLRHALWLSKRDKGRWKAEAIQLLRANGSEAALKLAEKIATKS